MHIRTHLEELIDQMLDGRIMLDEALNEFEKLYIQKALVRHKDHLSRTATMLGIHRNTLAKKVAAYKAQERAKEVPASNKIFRKSKTINKSKS
jgi:DNA-binding NtrC family response regulator